MALALSNPILSVRAVADPVVSEPVGQQLHPGTATFAPPPHDQVRAREVGAMLLVLTRRARNAIQATQGVTARTRIAARLVNKSRDLLYLVRSLEIDGDPGFRLIAARAGGRLAEIRTLIPVMHDTQAELRMIQAELQVLSGDLAAALAGLEPLMLSIRTIQGRDLRDEVAVRYLDLCIGRMQSRTGFIMFVEYLERRLPHGRIGARFGRELRLIAAHGEVLQDAGLWRSALMIRAWNRLAQIRPRRFAALLADVVFQHAGLAVVRRELRMASRPTGSGRAVRAMGGIGDLLMMTPGLRALAKRIGRPVEFAVPRRYLDLFETNPFVSAHAIEDLPADWYRDGPVTDLTDCPASIVESRGMPNVRINRIEIFARALGVGARELGRHGVLPMFEPSPTGRQRAEHWFRSHRVEPGKFIAVQAAAAEGYRTWNGMMAVARALAASMPVVVFDDKPLPGFDHLTPPHDNISLAVGLDLATGLALACEARLIVAPDSAFVHLAGARGIPCVAVFGPTDGALRTRAYRNTIVVSRAADLPCVPCWRNQATACMLTGGMSSQCLESLPTDPVIDAVMQLLRKTEISPRTR